MTTIIIMALFSLFVLGLVVPQKQFFKTKEQYDQWKSSNPYVSFVIETFRLNEIYVSPLTIIFFAVFFINLIVVIVHRIPVVLKKAYLMDRAGPVADISSIRDAADVRSFSLSGAARCEDIVRETAVLLKNRLWSIISISDAGTLLAVKNRYSPFGFLFFHLSFFLCLTGGILVTYTRFSGNLLLTVGEEFFSDMTRFRKINSAPKIFEGLPPFGIIVEEVNPSYEGDVSTDLQVEMRLKYWKEEENIRMRVNEPVKRGPIAILASDIGVSPLFVLRDVAGREISGGYFSLNVLKGKQDEFDFPSVPYRFDVHFYPDYAEANGNAFSRSPELKNPVIHLKVKKEGKVVREGNLGIGQALSFDGLQISFEDIRYWVDFLIVREYGRSVLFAGFLLGAIGLVMRMVFHQKELRVYAAKSGKEYTVFIVGKSDYYRYSFQEELDRLTNLLNGELRRRLMNVSSEGQGE